MAGGRGVRLKKKSYMRLIQVFFSSVVAGEKSKVVGAL